MRPITTYIGSNPSGNSESLNQCPPAVRLDLRVGTPDQQAKCSFSKHVRLKGRRWLQKVGLDRRWQPQEVHDLGNARSRYSFARRDFGLGEPGIEIKFLTPGTRQLDDVSTRPTLGWRNFVGTLEGVLDAGGKWDWAENEWLGSPSRNRYSHGHVELPAGSGFALASGAIFIGL